MRPEETYEFKNYITKNSDMIFVGHGHRGEEENIKSRETNYTYYLGEVLQDPDDSTNSGFSVTILDYEKKKIKKIIAKWDSKNHIYKLISNGEQTFVRNEFLLSMQLKYNDEFIKFLNSHDIEIQHRKKDNVTLEDLFIYPELRVFEETSKKSHIVIKSEHVKNSLLDYQNVIITGDNNYGKTALAKKLCLDYHNSGYLPLLINGKDIPALNKIDEFFNVKIGEQYNPNLIEKFNQTEKGRKILIIDDYNRTILNTTATQAFLKEVKQKYGYVILFSNITYEIGILIEAIEKPDNDFIICDIKEMGHFLRRKLIKKWYSLGSEHSIDEEKLEQLCRQAENTINILNGEGCILPTIPGHLLIILQQLDVAIPNENISSYGYLYEFLINRSILKLVDKGITLNPDIINGLLIETSYYLFINKKKLLNERDLHEIEKLYNNDYDEDIKYNQYLKSLIEVNIFKPVNHEIAFKYSYIYYYFIAKYLANNIEESFVLDHIDHMSNRLFNEEYGNIMIFLCHISKNTKIINNIIKNSMGIFSEYDLCDLSYQNKILKQLDNSISEISSSITLEPGSVAEHNDRYAIEKDNQELNLATDKLGQYYDETENPQINEMLKLNKAFKTMEVMGQILKNYPGTLKGDIKKILIQNTYKLGMRTLTVIYKLMGDEIEDFVENIRQKLYKNLPEVTIEALITAVKSTALKRMSLFSMILTYGMIRKISFCISNEALVTTFNKIRNEGDLTFRLIYSSIMLNNIGKMQSQEILDLFHELTITGNKFAANILRQMVVDHFYFFGIKDYGICQKVCDTLRIGKPDKRLLWK